MCKSENSIDWKVSGLVSFGPEDQCGEMVPGVYTKVAYYKEWINNVLKNHTSFTEATIKTTNSEPTTETIKSTSTDHTDVPLLSTVAEPTLINSNSKADSATITTITNSSNSLGLDLFPILSNYICMLVCLICK